jgi:hypothetical protein
MRNLPPRIFNYLCVFNMLRRCCRERVLPEEPFLFIDLLHRDIFHLSRLWGLFEGPRRNFESPQNIGRFAERLASDAAVTFSHAVSPTWNSAFRFPEDEVSNW